MHFRVMEVVAIVMLRLHDTKFIPNSRACHNGGSCISGEGSVTTSQFHATRCACVPPFGGADCSTVDACAGQYCNFRGDCRYNDDGSAHCECDASRWSGEQCELETCGAMTCQNGGSCRFTLFDVSV